MPKKNKIVFLDSSSVDFGDLDVRIFSKLGNYIAHADCLPDELCQKARDAEVIITNKTFIRGEHFSQLPCLKLVCVSATGYNNIDIEGARRHGVAVTNVAGYSTTTVAEHALLFMLATSHRLIENHLAVSRGEWCSSKHFALLDYPFFDLAGKTLGIIGYGTIGKQVSRLAKAFKMKVYVAKIPGRKYSKNESRVSLDKIFKEADFISIHSALNEVTKNLINRDNISSMKKTAVLLNLARGAIVDEEAVAQALERNDLGYYATDVFSKEPPIRENLLLNEKIASKVLITPHVAWASYESRQRLVNEIAENIKAFFRGKKRNRVD